MLTPKDVEQILRSFQKMKAVKQPMLPVYQLLSEFIQHRKYDFQGSNDAGAAPFVFDYLTDDTAAKANHLFASHMAGALWPNGAQSIVVRPPRVMRRRQLVSENASRWYQSSTQILATFMDDPKARLLPTLESYFNDQGTYGLSGIGVFDNETGETPLLFSALGAKQLYIREGANGFVTEIALEELYDVRRAAEEFGLEALHPDRQKLFRDGKEDTKFVILHKVGPRSSYDPAKPGVFNMPYLSCYIDCEKKHVIKESGFEEKPFAVGRFWQINGEVYPRSPGMNALPAIKEINIVREATIVNREVQAKPVWASWDEGAAGGRGLDLSPDAFNIFSPSTRLQSGSIRTVEPLWAGGEMRGADERVIQLQEDIKNHWYQDRLYDLNNETEMTLGEAQIRDRLRGQALGPIYSRQISDVLLPIAERSFNKLFALGYFGVIEGSPQEDEALDRGIEPVYVPAEIAELILAGEDFYDIEFISPAARLLNFEELQGLQRTMELGAGVMNIAPEAIDCINFDKVYKMAVELNMANADVFRSDEDVARIRQQRAEQQAELMQLQAMQAGAGAAKDAASAAQSASQAQR